MGDVTSSARMATYERVISFDGGRDTDTDAIVFDKVSVITVFLMLDFIKIKKHRVS